MNRRPGHLPSATYRLQLNREFTFADATRIVPYLARLGISHIYASPILKARPGSMHGYDVTDHTLPQSRARHAGGFRGAGRGAARARHGTDRRHRAESSRRDGRRQRLVARRARERARGARRAIHFDIDWRPNRASMRDRVLVPVLGDAYGAVLERGELQLQLDPRRRQLRDSLSRASACRSIRASIRASSRRADRRDAARGGRCASRRLRKPAERVRAICRRAAIPPRTRSRSAIATRRRTSAGSCACWSAARRSSSTSRRRCARSTARRAIRAASMLSTRCSTRRRIDCRTGAWRSMRSTTGASSTSTTSPRCAWTRRECSTARTGSPSS